MLSIDFAILNFIYDNFRSSWLDVLMPLITSLGNAGAIWIVLALCMLISKKYRKAGIAVCCALVLDVIICNVILKPMVARIRPYDINTAIQLLIHRPTDFSFPSGHTAASFSAVSALYFSRQRIWIPSLILAVLIAFSRLYLYVHYPSDVLAGILLGCIFGFAGCRLSNHIYKWH
ncbi:phosphatase PAP2 family protein [Sedimentibacter sp.]|uniref:phosphatase PAP2 family protein n=1 Tax=Sedimentibacter sp. TaxID=1960295 RepID=UPI0028963094|nr:phosphatase PAP2 family protein [Sedimentibacter sp.]